MKAIATRGAMWALRPTYWRGGSRAPALRWCGWRRGAGGHRYRGVRAATPSAFAERKWREATVCPEGANRKRPPLRTVGNGLDRSAFVTRRGAMWASRPTTAWGRRGLTSLRPRIGSWVMPAVSPLPSKADYSQKIFQHSLLQCQSVYAIMVPGDIVNPK